MKYLYGARVQGIQSFIFATNKLKEMVGASEMVERICTAVFKEKDIGVAEADIIVAAAGKIKLICTEQQLSRICRDFSKKVQEFAPGISISQAAVSCEDDTILARLKELEDNLQKQANRPARPDQIGWTVFVRAPRTGASCAYKKRRRAFRPGLPLPKSKLLKIKQWGI